MYYDRESLDELEADAAQQLFSDTAELQDAAELLDINSETELDQFLGRLIKRAARATGRLIRSDAGRALGGMLRATTKKALPALGKAVATTTDSTTDADRLFGLELEGMSPEDKEFETARRVVRLANAAATKLSALPTGTAPRSAAKTALVSAARRHAPGLLRPPHSTSTCCPHCGARNA